MSNSSPAVLITMPHSHYAEKARWGLDWLAMPYREEPHVPLLHRLPTTRNGGRSVPVLLHEDKRLIDSTDILMHADAHCGGDRLYPSDAALRGEVKRSKSNSTPCSARTPGAGPMPSCCRTGACCAG